MLQNPDLAELPRNHEDAIKKSQQEGGRMLVGAAAVMSHFLTETDTSYLYDTKYIPYKYKCTIVGR